MRKLVILLLSLLLSLALAGAAHAAPQVLLDGRQLLFSGPPPQVEGGEILAPMAGISQALGAEARWDPDPASDVILVTRGSDSVRFVLGHKALINGRLVDPGVPARMAEDVALLPAKFLAQALGFHAIWDAAQETLYIGPGGVGPSSPGKGVAITWLGQASFRVEGNRRLITDPYNDKVGYPLPGLAADLVTVSHQHGDHNYVQGVAGLPQVVRELGYRSLDGVRFTGIPTFHDSEQGKKRGANTVYVIEMDGVRICHLGDLGHTLDDAALNAIGKVDALLIPVGGFFTIDAATARQVVAQIKPAYAVPMHYRTEHFNRPNVTGVEEFLKAYPAYFRAPELKVDPSNLPASTQVVVLELWQPKPEPAAEPLAGGYAKK